MIPTSNHMRLAVAVVGMLTTLFVVAHLQSIRWFPLPWVDEVMYTDPSINYLQGRGFTSTAWPSQPGDALWAGNTPLHEWLLIPWIRVFGFTPEGVRSINVAFVALTVLVLTWAARRLGWLSSPLALVAMVCLFFTSVGMAHVARDARPDGIKALVASLAFLAYTVPPPRRRIALFLAGLLFLPAGFQVVMFGFVVCVIAWIWMGKSFFRDGFTLGLGIVVGFVLLMAFYAANGQARSFIENTLASGHTLTGDVAQAAMIGDEKVKARLGGRLTSAVKLIDIFRIDPVHPLLLGFCALGTIGLLATKKIRWRDPIMAGFAVSVAAPIISTLTGKYFLHYTWIGSLPLLLTTALILDRLAYIPRILGFIALLVICLAGSPTEFVLKGSQGESEFEMIDTVLQYRLLPEDCVYADDPFYYAAKSRVKTYLAKSYSGGRGFREISEVERNAVTVLIVRTSEFEEVKKKIGGNWERIWLIDLNTRPPEDREFGVVEYGLYLRK